MTVACPVGPRCALDADGQRAGGWQVEGVEVDVADLAVEPDRLVGERQRQGDGDVGADDPELAGGDGDARLAAAVDGVDRSGLGRRAHRDAEVDVAQVAGRADELEVGRVVTQRFGGVQELGTGGVTAGAAGVVGWIPVDHPDEEHGVDGLGDVGVAEPDRLAPFLAAGAHPLGQPMAGVGRFDDHGLHEVVLAGQEQLSAGFGGGDGRGGHELGDAEDGVDAQFVVADVGAHAVTLSSCWAHHA